MKIRSILLSGVIALFFLCGVSLRAQGIYSTNQTTTTTAKPVGGGVYRDLGDTGSGGTFGGGGEAAGGNDPIGEGFLILSLLSAGYALLKKSTRGKHED